MKLYFFVHLEKNLARIFFYNFWAKTGWAFFPGFWGFLRRLKKHLQSRLHNIIAQQNQLSMNIWINFSCWLFFYHLQGRTHPCIIHSTQESRKFAQVDRDFRDLTKKAHTVRNAMQVCCEPGVLQMLKENNKLLDEVQKRFVLKGLSWSAVEGAECSLPVGYWICRRGQEDTVCEQHLFITHPCTLLLTIKNALRVVLKKRWQGFKFWSRHCKKCIFTAHVWLWISAIFSVVNFQLNTLGRSQDLKTDPVGPLFAKGIFIWGR